MFNLFRKKRPRGEAVIDLSKPNLARKTLVTQTTEAQTSNSTTSDNFLVSLAIAAAEQSQDIKTDETNIAERLERLGKRLDKLFERMDLVEHKISRIERRIELKY